MPPGSLDFPAAIGMSPEVTVMMPDPVSPLSLSYAWASSWILPFTDP